MRARLLFSLVFVVALACPPVAAADDVAIKDAWHSEDARGDAQGERFTREVKRWEKRGFTRDERVLAPLRRAEALARLVWERVNAAEPSTPTGAEAKTWALRALQSSMAGLRATRAAIRVRGRRITRRTRRAWKRAARILERATREGERTEQLFREAGVA
jgi:hypothetical protein